MPRRHVALVAGASGIVGYRLAQSLVKSGRWDVIGIARKPPLANYAFQFLPVDLTDIDDCCSKLSPLARVTHVFNAAQYISSGEQSKSDKKSIGVNLAMSENLVEAIEKKSRSLKHIHLVHGTGHYGSSLEYRKTPFKEDDPRQPRNTFYYVQQDFIIDRQKGKAWSWSISRPQLICDHPAHVARSLPLGIAVYATISRALGKPLSFPGCTENYKALQQCTEASHLAAAMTWMATNEQCANQAFNVSNGDCFRWENLWPRLASFFNMSIGPVRGQSLDKTMASHGELWGSVTTSSKIRKISYENLVLWPYVDRVFSSKSDQISDVTKLRKFGFGEFVETEDMFFRFFRSYVKAGLISR